MPVALGSDTGGSVQVPAGLNGVVGFKPSHGLISTAGTTVLSPSLDHVGIIARDVRDIGMLLGPLIGRPALDLPTRATPVDELIIAVPDAFFLDRLAPDVAAAYHNALDTLTAAGARLQSFTPPLWEHYAAVEDLVCITEFAAAQGERVRAFPNDFGPVARHYVEVGYRIPVAAYQLAKRAQALIRLQWIERLREADLVLTPTAPITAPRIGTSLYAWPDGTQDDGNELLGRLAVPAEIAGLPSITVPGGIEADGPPIGLQLIGRNDGDLRLLAAATLISHLDHV